eukprot:CAMPEP_0205893588 /NCGR_PEP_ID=MMETSP1083-20121108/23348_1 /ASSEMBLY_ACC=CAM_ASM_000430 /TAXON_ID=97485 /ORGANISM="Prymnesium parvum, Strain Texoma1" /LENGTH=98 /DNA_ID=CAMNT_0053258299 /DNA_START=378 /DNA_END=674 /DNA_ORIENTATION=-
MAFASSNGAAASFLNTVQHSLHRVLSPHAIGPRQPVGAKQAKLAMGGTRSLTTFSLRRPEPSSELLGGKKALASEAEEHRSLKACKERLHLVTARHKR